jgi:putative transposase
MARVVVPGVPHHVTQRGNDRQDIFFADADRVVYLELLKKLSRRCGIEVHGYCLMTNHVHLIVVPSTEAALAQAIGRAHQLYAQHVNELYHRVGHLWNSRFYSCPMDDDHYLAGLRYAECNPKHAGLVLLPWEYPWSSAAAHCSGVDPTCILEFRYWRSVAGSAYWREYLCDDDDVQIRETMRKHTLRGRPLGDDRFIAGIEERLGRCLRPCPVGRPRKPTAKGSAESAALENR